MDEHRTRVGANSRGSLAFPWCCEAVCHGLTDDDRALLAALAELGEDDIARIGTCLCDAVDRTGLAIGVPHALTAGLERGLAIVAALMGAHRIPTADGTAYAVALDRRAAIELRARRVLDDSTAVGFSMTVRRDRRRLSGLRAAELRRGAMAEAEREDLEVALDGLAKKRRLFGRRDED